MADENNNMEKVLDSTEDLDDQYLTFVLAGEVYGVEILRVEEIRGWEMVTRIPNSPQYMKGILNIRGVIVPVINLRERFDIEAIDYSATTVVIILKVESYDKDHIVGIVVDAVSDVLDAKKTDVKKAPDFGDAVNTECISGLIEANDRMVMLLNVDKMLGEERAEAEEDTEDEAA